MHGGLPDIADRSAIVAHRRVSKACAQRSTGVTGSSLSWSNRSCAAFRYFAGSFTLRAAATVAADSDHSESEIIDNVLELVAKSLIMADKHDLEPRLRLLETTRAYARIKLAESGKCDTIYRRHAEVPPPCRVLSRHVG